MHAARLASIGEQLTGASRLLSIVVLAMVPVLAGCGGIAVYDDGGGGGTTGANATTTQAASSGVSRAVSATGGTGFADVQPTLGNATITLRCKGSDASSVITSTSVTYENRGSAPGNLDVLSGFLTVDASSASFPLEIDPPRSGLVAPGETVQIEHRGLGNVDGPACAICGSHGRVRLVYTDITVTSDDAEVMCLK